MSWKSWSWKLLLLIIAGALLFIWLIKAPILSWYLTEKLNVPTSVGSVHFKTSDITFERFRIKNPSGFKMKTAFEAETITMNWWHKDKGGPVEIDRIVVDDIFLGVECSNPMCSQNNWTAIGNGMLKKQANEKKHDVVVHKLILQNMTVEIRGLGLGKPPIRKQIDYLEFNEVSSEKGFPTDKLIRAIFQGAGLQDYIQNLLNPQNVLKKALPGGLFGDAE